ncbi:MAG: hypothetical protein R2753_04665 [Chitinophagales bacterium]
MMVANSLFPFDTIWQTFPYAVANTNSSLKNIYSVDFVDIDRDGNLDVLIQTA